MSTTDLDIRRMTLEEAAIEMCGYCQGCPGHAPCPVQMYDGTWNHLFTVGNGSNPCQSGPIWTMIQNTKLMREAVRKARAPRGDVKP